ncbi:DUF2894 domain-containing protein [Marinobacter salinexigens]|uniref:DUF2894 domain-containing protein n=1 Tax=Marinobacter salinexigens TaxID=2919747 RepID=A0A5B0VN80_9GAMM|nr:DUF2894 domain-containing protein [Marinobacter salinexigens]KAA1176017.1 DUF2894 domain-containing protein [Marinobacter salinexigens]
MTAKTSPRDVADQQIAQLRQAGADQADPVRFRYLEALDRRLREREQKRGLEDRKAWGRLLEGLKQFGSQHLGTPDQPEQGHPTPQTSPLTQLLDLLNSQQPEPARTSSSPLMGLLADYGTDAFDKEQPEEATTANAPRQLKAMARVKARQGELSLEHRIQAAIEHAPANAGPMNAHRLVSRAILEMQRLSPDYLRRFASYADTLLALEKLNTKG